MKLDKNSIKQVLVRFEVCSPDTSGDKIQRLHKIHPSPTTIGFSFMFDNRPMWLVFDEDADDDFVHLAKLAGVNPADLKLYPNPRHPDSYGLPILSKTAYLLEQTSLKQRLDHRLQADYPDWSRSKLQRQIVAGAVTIDGKTITVPSQLVGDQKIEFNPIEVKKEPQNFQILYQDGDILAIDKPAGVLSHARPDQDSEWTVEDFVRQYSQIKTGPVLAHRLDRLTSGVILAAKNTTALADLQRQFKRRSIQKTYLAIVEGKLPHQEAIIDLPLARSAKSSQKFQVDARGKTAQTEYQVLQAKNHRMLVQIKPLTGRTHQIRVHLAHLGAPIVGDSLYGGAGGSRMMLHSSQIVFSDLQGQLITVDCPAPSEFQL